MEGMLLHQVPRDEKDSTSNHLGISGKKAGKILDVEDIGSGDVGGKAETIRVIIYTFQNFKGANFLCLKFVIGVRRNPIASQVRPHEIFHVKDQVTAMHISCSLVFGRRSFKVRDCLRMSISKGFNKGGGVTMKTRTIW